LPVEAATIPLPKLEQTPPVTKIYLGRFIIPKNCRGKRAETPNENLLFFLMLLGPGMMAVYRL